MQSDLAYDNFTPQDRFDVTFSLVCDVAEPERCLGFCLYRLAKEKPGKIAPVGLGQFYPPTLRRMVMMSATDKKMNNVTAKAVSRIMPFAEPGTVKVVLLPATSIT